VSKVWEESLRGPLGGDAAGFVAQLSRLGYSESAADKQLRMLAALSWWLDDEELGVDAVATDAVERFFDARRAAGIANLRTRRSLLPLVEYLRGADRLQETPLVVAGPVEVLLGSYRVYLSSERGLVEGTIGGYVRVARRFLTECLTGAGMGLGDLSAGLVREFVTRSCSRLGLSATRHTISALRCLLRYLTVEGLVPVSLDQSLLSVPGGGTPLPRGMDAAALRLVLAGCDRRRAVGRRDFAVLMLLARLGLRGGEVVGLCLGDVDWRAGEVTVRGKGGRSDRLPLPVDVGEALASYLRRGRPGTQSRKVFVRHYAPFCGFCGTGALRGIMDRACKRAGVPYASPHRLRHSVATAMLRHGAPLSEIGQVLRHASPRATAIYAAVDHESLRALASDWPGVER
jgi:integrase/recombinase XerD